jgi:hypothetical protein
MHRMDQTILRGERLRQQLDRDKHDSCYAIIEHDINCISFFAICSIDVTDVRKHVRQPTAYHDHSDSAVVVISPPILPNFRIMYCLLLVVLFVIACRSSFCVIVCRSSLIVLSACLSSRVCSSSPISFESDISNQGAKDHNHNSGQHRQSQNQN